MPQQESYFKQNVGDRRVEILKVYDMAYAREAFANMDEAAQIFLRRSLCVDENYYAADVPSLSDLSAEDFLWEELLEAAREDGNLLSFFVVNEAKDNVIDSLFVSPDWPSAESYAKRHIASVPSTPPS